MECPGCNRGLVIKDCDIHHVRRKRGESGAGVFDAWDLMHFPSAGDTTNNVCKFIVAAHGFSFFKDNDFQYTKPKFYSAADIVNFINDFSTKYYSRAEGAF